MNCPARPSLRSRSRRAAAMSANACGSCVREQQSWQGEVWMRRVDGEPYPAWLTVGAVRDAAGMLTNFVCTQSDISARKQADEKILQLAYYDSLTGLPNRRLLYDRIRPLPRPARPHRPHRRPALPRHGQFQGPQRQPRPRRRRPAAAAGRGALARLHARDRYRGAPGRRRIRDPARIERRRRARKRSSMPRSSATRSSPRCASRSRSAAPRTTPAAASASRCAPAARTNSTT